MAVASCSAFLTAPGTHTTPAEVCFQWVAINRLRSDVPTPFSSSKRGREVRCVPWNAKVQRRHSNQQAPEALRNRESGSESCRD
jgi:hypothetical protein